MFNMWIMIVDDLSFMKQVWAKFSIVTLIQKKQIEDVVLKVLEEPLAFYMIKLILLHSYHSLSLYLHRTNFRRSMRVS